MFEEEYVTLIPRHKQELLVALEEERGNRRGHLKFHNILVFERFHERAIKEVHQGSVSTRTLAWCYDQFLKYGAVGNKEYVKSLKEWMPLAIQLPYTYEAFPDKVIDYKKEKPMYQFDDDLMRFLFDAQCFAEYFKLDFDTVLTEYWTKKKTLLMAEWVLLQRMFGDSKMRKSIAARLDVPLKDIPLMPKAYSVHIQQMDNIVLNQRYSSLEIVAKVERHRNAIFTMALGMLDKRYWIDDKGSIVFNPIKSDWMRDKAGQLLLSVVESDYKVPRETQQKVNYLLKDLGLDTKVLYWV